MRRMGRLGAVALLAGGCDWILGIHDTHLVPGDADATPDAPPPDARAHTRFAVDADTVALWHMDDGGGQYLTNEVPTAAAVLGADDSVAADDPQWRNECAFDSCLSFDVDIIQYVSVTGIPTLLEEITIEFWYRSIYERYQYPISMHGSSSLLIEVTPEGGIGVFYGTPSDPMGAAANADGAMILDGTWHYVATVYERGSLRLYLDGALAASMEDGPYDFSLPSEMWLGGMRDYPSSVEGDIDEVRISSRARTDAEIASHF